MSVHDGHRQRVKERFRKEGLDNFDDLHVLELLLFYCVARKDTNLMAHALLDRFGSLAQVLEATPMELEKVPGVGEHISSFLSLINSVGRRYQISKAAPITVLRNVEQCGEYLLPHFYGRVNEVVFLLCMDAKCKVLSCLEVGEGSVNSAGVPIRRIVEQALGINATSVVLAHNHPSGVALPSADDIQTTKRLAIALSAVDITLVDHLVISDGDYVSMVQSGYYRPEDCYCIV